MRIVKNSFLLTVNLLLFTMCQNTNLTHNESIDLDTVFIEKRDTLYIDNLTYINHEKDSVFYVLGGVVPTYHYQDTFLVTKSIWVRDSCFGISNQENWNKASDFNYNNITYTYHISFLIKGRKQNFLNIRNVHYSQEVRLDKGYGNNYLKSDIQDYFLRVILYTDFFTLSHISLNYFFDDNLNPQFSHKERVHVRKNHNQDTRNIGYCLDTLYRINEKNIDWFEVTDTYAWRNCK